MKEPERDKLIALLDRTASDLGEHFDAVQIHASTCDESGTWTISRGCGNWNARQGMAHSFIKQDEASDQAKFIASELNREE